MKKIYSPILSLAAALLVAAAPASAASFEIEENFDDDSHFTLNASLPDGWHESGNAHIGRIDASESGFLAHTDPKILAVNSPTGGETLYTPMMEIAGGTTFTVEFSTLLPGHPNYPSVRNLGINVYAGSVADKSRMDLIGNLPHGYNPDWKQLSYNFTPATDGEYCFAIELYCENGMYGGNAYFDTFFFTGIAPGGGHVAGLEPDPENMALCHELPYMENFSDPSHYDGTGHLPTGWSSTGTTVWRTASFTDLVAVNGDYYMLTPESRSERDERAYTPFFNLTAGREYTVSYCTHFDGYIINGEPRTATLRLTVGTQQDADFHPLAIHTSSRAIDKDPQWVAETATFTPSVSGPYCFAFMLEGEPYSGFICVDDLRITSPADQPRPEPDMSPMALKSFVSDHFIANSHDPVRFFNNSRYSESFDWYAEGATVYPLPNGNADIIFPASGDYDVTMTAVNDRGSRTLSRTVSIDNIDNGLPYTPVVNYDRSTCKEYTRHGIPAWPTDPNGLDYISGINHYYRTLAQRFDLPQRGTTTISRIAMNITNSRFEPIEGGATQQFELPFSFKIYGADEQGNIDEGNLLGQTSAPMEDFFPIAGMGSAEWNYMDLQTPVNCSGTIYVVVDLSEDLHVDVSDPRIGRTFLSFGMMQGRHRQTTFFTKPYNVPEGSGMTSGHWYPIDAFDSQYAGIGLNMQLYVDYNGISSGICESILDPGSAIGIDLRDNVLTIAGTSPGEYVAVYTTDGQRVSLTRAESEITTLDCSPLIPGLYIVRTDSGCRKFFR